MVGALPLMAPADAAATPAAALPIIKSRRFILVPRFSKVGRVLPETEALVNLEPELLCGAGLGEAIDYGDLQQVVAGSKAPKT